MTRRTLTTRSMWLAISLAIAVPSAAHAKRVCIRTTALGGWTFVLKDATFRPGNSGTASGYAIRDDGFASPISGGFVVFPSTVHLGITRYGTGLFVDGGGGGTSYTTTFHQVQAFLDGGPGGDWSWTREIGGTITNTSGDARLIDCTTVKPVPSAP